MSGSIQMLTFQTGSEKKPCITLASSDKSLSESTESFYGYAAPLSFAPVLASGFGHSHPSFRLPGGGQTTANAALAGTGA